MRREGLAYGEALARAQALGYAEADPTEDVGGADAAAKMAILASIAFHTRVHWTTSRTRASTAWAPRTWTWPPSSGSWSSSWASPAWWTAR